MSTTIWETAPGPHPPTGQLPSPYTPDATPTAETEYRVPPPTSPPDPVSDGLGPKRRGNTGKLVAIVAGAVVLVGAGFVGRDLVGGQTTATPAPVTAGGGQPAATSGGQGVEQVAKTLSPAVVQIQTNEGLGSGVVYDASGLVLTNAHVVGSSTQVQVTMSGGKQAQGEVLGADTSADIAVVKIDGNGVTVAPLSTETAQVGENVAAVGSPFGLQGTVTAGIVSATDRPVDGEQGVSTKMIQTDAPINPGNSGGALANTTGEVIGINTAIFSQKGENNGIGFAIPIGTAKSVADQIVSGNAGGSQQSQGQQSQGQQSQGRQPNGQGPQSQGQQPNGQGPQGQRGQQGQTSPRSNGNGTGRNGQAPGNGNASPTNPQASPGGRALLGVTLQPSGDGAVVAQVAPGSPAATAGLKTGDVITGVDGDAVDSAASLQAAIAAHQPGDQVTLEVQRGTQQGSVDVTLGAASN